MHKKIKILVVEDNPIKVKSIESFLKEINFTLKVDYVLTPSEAIQNLKSLKYDFLILDMSLPAYSEESHIIGSLSGKQILQTMKHKNIAVPTVILTQWDVFGHHDATISLDSLTKDLKEKFNKFLLDVVFWDSSSDLWKENIMKYIIGLDND